MHVQIKICGITTLDAVRAARDAGADAVGFVFAESPRRVTTDRARMLMSQLPPFVARVAVFRHPTATEVSDVIDECIPDLVQSEPAPEIRAETCSGTRLLPVFHDGENHMDEVRAYTEREACGNGVLLEASGRGGRGVTPSWEVAARIAKFTSLVLAGGLNPENVEKAILRVQPAAVDVSSGVELSPGRKDPALIRDFVHAVREAEKRLREEVNL